MAQHNRPLSPMAQLLLDRHRKEPESLQYDIDVLSSMFRPDDLDRLDQAYQELETAGLVDRAGAPVTLLGRPVSLYKLKTKGGVVGAAP